MGRGAFSREFKLEAVRLVKGRGVAVAQAARDLDIHPNVLRNWLKDFEADPRIRSSLASTSGESRQTVRGKEFFQQPVKSKPTLSRMF